MTSTSFDILRQHALKKPDSAIGKNNNVPWIEKYRPHNLDDMEQTQNLKAFFKNNIDSNEMSHYLFYGPPGTGKTSAILAMGREIFKEYYSSRIIEFNASDDRGINAVREKITNEAKKYVTEIRSEDGTVIPPYKIIILDEADSMTDDAQDALRVIIEQYSNVTRFCFICNYINKITDAIKSRCARIYFKKLSNECMINKLNSISEKESMNLSENILHTIIDVSNGDMRKAIMMLQNLKYLYDYKSYQKQQMNKLPITFFKYMPMITTKNVNPEVCQDDIYLIACTISNDEARRIVNNIFKKKNIKELTDYGKRIVGKGYPIDNILSQLNKEIIQTNKLTNYQKARIIHYSGDIFYKIKECANEYIQLIDYMACVHGVKSNNPVYLNAF